MPRNNIRYGHVPSGHPGAPPEIIIGEPIFTNPCSFANCAEVLRKIGKDTGIIRYGEKKGTGYSFAAMVCHFVIATP